MSIAPQSLDSLQNLMKQDRYIREIPGSFHIVKAKMLQALPTVLIFSQIALTLFWRLASDTQLLIPAVLQIYPLVDESPLSLPLAQGASVLQTLQRAIKRQLCLLAVECAAFVWRLTVIPHQVRRCMEHSHLWAHKERSSWPSPVFGSSCSLISVACHCPSL